MRLITTCTAVLMLAAGPAFEFAQATADQLLDVESYVEAVLAAPGHGSLPGGAAR